MVSFDPPFRYILSAQLLQHLRNSFHQINQWVDEDTVRPEFCVHTEASLGLDATVSESIDYFSLVMSRSFNALLVAQRLGEPDTPAGCVSIDNVDSCDALAPMTRLAGEVVDGTVATQAREEGPPVQSSPISPGQYAVSLTLELGEIEQFVAKLVEQLPAETALPTALQHRFREVDSNQSGASMVLVRLLLESLTRLGQYTESISSAALELREPNGFQRSGEFDYSKVTQSTLSESLPPETGESPTSGSDHPLQMPSLGDRQSRMTPSTPSSNSLFSPPNVEVTGTDSPRVEDAKTIFLAMINHELRTPLTYILGMSTTLLRWIDDRANVTLQRQQRHYLESIYNQGKHLLEMINSILDLSQSELGQIALNIQQISLSRLIEHCIRTYQAEADRQEITLTLETQRVPPWDVVAADPHRLQQILASLLSNAIKFTPRGGHVTVRLLLTNAEATIQVQDTGIGIAEQHRATIFQKFKQIDNSYRRQYEGTGIGLALAKQLVELHGGCIDCDSTVNVGTVFTVRLPRTSNETALERRASIPTTAEASGKRIVLVSDDDSETINAIADSVMTSGYHLIWIPGKDGVVARIARLQPRIVLVNLQLGDTEALAAIRLLRQDPVGEQLMVVAIDLCHSPGELEMAHHCQTLGVDKVLTPPFDIAELLNGLDTPTALD